MKFTKMQGLGNDYLYFYEEVPENVEELAIRLSDRHFGAGSDGLIYICHSDVADFKMPIGDMLAYMQYVMQIIMAFLMIAQMFIMLPRALVAAGRVEEVLQREPTIRNRENLKTLSGRAKGHIEFDHVSFKYGDAESNVLEDINLDILPGQTVAFIGFRNERTSVKSTGRL